MFKLFHKNKKEESIATDYLSLFWDQSEEVVHFQPFFKLMREYDLKVIDMTFRSIKSKPFDNRNYITFVVTGTFDNLVKFEKEVPNLYGMDVFKVID